MTSPLLAAALLVATSASAQSEVVSRSAVKAGSTVPAPTHTVRLTGSDGTVVWREGRDLMRARPGHRPRPIAGQPKGSYAWAASPLGVAVRSFATTGPTTRIGQRITAVRVRVAARDGDLRPLACPVAACGPVECWSGADYSTIGAGGLALDGLRVVQKTCVPGAVEVLDATGRRTFPAGGLGVQHGPQAAGGRVAWVERSGDSLGHDTVVVADAVTGARLLEVAVAVSTEWLLGDDGSIVTRTAGPYAGSTLERVSLDGRRTPLPGDLGPLKLVAGRLLAHSSTRDQVVVYNLRTGARHVVAAAGPIGFTCNTPRGCLGDADLDARHVAWAERRCDTIMLRRATLIAPTAGPRSTPCRRPRLLSRTATVTPRQTVSIRMRCPVRCKGTVRLNDLNGAATRTVRFELPRKATRRVRVPLGTRLGSALAAQPDGDQVAVLVDAAVAGQPAVLVQPLVVRR